ncbi:MAG: phosphatidyl inositol kinase [Trizodia sp. TS-e1964]|nr:MAG: phosphatidyl inositol kinase [Trizodia sp. TS-e1964]
MPKTRPPTSGYARIAQAEEETGFLDESDDEAAYLSQSALTYAPITQQLRPYAGSMTASAATSPPEYRRAPRSGQRRMRSNSSGVDIKAINARLEKWAEEIASKFKIGKARGPAHEDEQLEIHHSVFQPPDAMRPATADTLASDFPPNADGPITTLQFEAIVESVRVAIEAGVHPKMISQGSSGSYFARNSDGKIVGVFKPKDEEPYASRNPKWTKWIHRNLFPCFFGRACLIPNLSYVSEAAAYVLDRRLRTNLVPYTDIVYLSSKSFHYDFWDRRSFYRSRKPFPEKVGSFQVFLKGFKDANIFLRDHPWPDQPTSTLRRDGPRRRRTRAWNETCRPTGVASDDEQDDAPSDAGSPMPDVVQERRFFWTDALQQSFREELEKLVILDYIMRNTDRGLDNWMIRVDWDTQSVSIVSEAPQMNAVSGGDAAPQPLARSQLDGIGMSDLNPYRLQEPMAATSRSATPLGTTKGTTMVIGAIDNSLSWPWKHPDAWRSFPFGWLFLPVSLIGQPFSQKTREHFLPLLTSTKWWGETQLALRRVFSQDADFKERMFAGQIAVMKGQAWNVVETLKTPDHGPLELTRRARVCVWDDIVDIPVAVPLRMPSAEMRRRRDKDMQRGIDEEEMDISAMNSSAPLPQHDLLGLNNPAMDLPNPKKFSLSRASSVADARPSQDTNIPTDGVSSERRTSAEVFDRRLAFSDKTRPGHSRSRRSYDAASRRGRGSSGYRPGGSSFSARQGSAALLYDGDDLEGDLGYAAAQGMEGNQRKVIMERLETVKSKNPVFTWC